MRKSSKSYRNGIPPVSELPFIDSLTELSIDERKRLGLYLPSGQLNYYRIMQMKGFGGFRKELTWDKAAHMHNCCGSKVPWRHKVSCPQLHFKDEESTPTNNNPPQHEKRKETNHL